MSDVDRAQEIWQRRTRSYDWMKANFYPEWEQVFKSYKCERDPELDSDGKPDPTRISVGLPMTWSHIRRMVARGTAQIPNLKFHAKEKDAGELISRTLMYQWDKGVQIQQKKHFTQAALFGISVRPWYWAVESHTRNKRVNPLDPNLSPEALQAIAAKHGVVLEHLLNPDVGLLIRAKLAAEAGRGGLLPIDYQYTGYVGPRCDFLFLGDCYFQPHFQSIQSSQWFIVERRRSLEWMKKTIHAYPEMKNGFDTLVRQFPEGSPRPSSQRDAQGLRERMMAAIGHSDDTSSYATDKTREWTIMEQHTPGEEPKLAYVGEQSVFIGEVKYPYDLDGKIAFTELVLIDDLLCGIGDSTARIIRGLQQLHDKSANSRMDLVNNLLHPLFGTSNRELLENPGLIKRHGGFRVVPMRGPHDLWMQSEQAALAAAAAGLQDESALMRLYQMATGESNMSSMANVDPQQNRTATGARLMAYNQDILTKDLTDKYNDSIKADAEMMFMLNRSEMSDPVEFDAAQYNRTYSPEQDPIQEQWVAAEPALFQKDGEIVSEVGSTLADDDESNVAKATNLFQAALSAPQLFNAEKARDAYLIAMGKGRELKEWVAPPPPPPPPSEIKPSMTISAKWELLTPQEQSQIMGRIGVDTPPVDIPPGGPLPEEGAPPPGPVSAELGPGGPPPEMPPMAPEPSPLTMSAVLAARGRSPFTHSGPPV